MIDYILDVSGGAHYYFCPIGKLWSDTRFRKLNKKPHGNNIPRIESVFHTFLSLL